MSNEKIDLSVVENPQAISETTRWCPNIVENDNFVQMDDGLQLQWKLSEPGNALASPSCRGVNNNGSQLLEVDTVVGVNWVRLRVPLRRKANETIFTVRILIKLTGSSNNEGVLIDPMLACQPDPEKSWLNPLPASRVAGKIHLQPDKWCDLTGIFSESGQGADSASVLLVNLPAPYRFQIAQLDVDWHEGAAGIPHNPDETFHPISPFKACNVEPALLPDWTVGAVPSLADLSQELKRQPQQPISLGTALILRAHTQVGSKLLAGFIEWADPGKFEMGDKHDGLESSLVSLLIHSHLGNIQNNVLSRLDIDALRAINQVISEGGRLGTPRRIAIEFSSTLATNLKHWKPLIEKGLLERKKQGSPDGCSQVLRVEKDFRISQFSAAFLRCAETTLGGASIGAKELLGSAKGGWRSQVSRFPTSGLDTDKVVEVATLSETAENENLERVKLTLGEVDATSLKSLPEIDAENAFAFVLKLDPQSDVSGLSNVDRCVVFNSLKELQDRFSDPSPRLRCKPVVIIPLTEFPADHLIQSVKQHWAHSGLNVISPVCCSYNVERGNIHLRLINQPELSPMVTLHAVTSMPLQEIGNLNATDLAFCPSEGFGLSLPNPKFRRLYREKVANGLSAHKISLAEHESLALFGTPYCYEALSKVDQNRNWSVAEIVSPLLRAHRILLSDLRNFSTVNNAQLADSILERLDLSSPNIAAMNDEISHFVLQLAGDESLLLGLKSDNFLKFLQVLRQSSRIDESTARLMVIADRIFSTNIDHIPPFLATLACGLDQQEMNSVLLVGAKQCVDNGNRFLKRIAEGHQRYGSPLALSFLFSILHKEHTAALFGPNVLRYFKSLLGSEYQPVIEAHFGKGVTQKIHDAVSATEKFTDAVRCGDRASAMSHLGNSSAMERIDFLKFMDELRGLSNELRKLDLNIDAIDLPGMDRLPHRKLAAVILSDIAALNEMRTAGFLNYPDPLNAVALNLLGDNEALNKVIGDSFNGSPYKPAYISGNNTLEVFVNAQIGLSDLQANSNGALVSVIMSAFNPDLPLMEAALDSLHCQTHQKIEILVVDDASSPENAKGIFNLVEQYDEARLIRLDTNCGPYVGRNVALGQAKGDFIAIHDADDWAHPQLLEAQVAAFDEAKEIRLVSSNHIRIDRAGRIQQERDFSIFGDGPMTSMFRRVVFDEIGPFAEIRSRGDVEMRERLLSYYGKHAVKTYEIPLKFCFADSATLSQRTVRDNTEYLQQWRSNISLRGSLRYLRHASIKLDKQHQIAIPKVLRAPRSERFVR